MRKQKVDYKNTTYCKNTLGNSGRCYCISCMEDCRHYITLKKNNGIEIGCCKLNEPLIEKDFNNVFGKCKNRERDLSTCLGDVKDCIHYIYKRKTTGEVVGVCKLRYDFKQAQKSADIQRTQDIATYNGRRN